MKFRATLLLLLVVFSLSFIASKRGKSKGKGKPKPKPVRPTIYKPPNPKIFKKYTKKSNGGRCWWDMTRTDCAKCKRGAMQCGYPMHKYCYKFIQGQGCPGIPNPKYTLSTKGYPCYWDHKDQRCAWCSLGNHQCGPGEKGEQGPDSKLGSRCMMSKDSTYCDSVVADCVHIPYCDSNASCVEDKKVGKIFVHKCKCNNGFTGNGIQCANENGTIGAGPEILAELELDLISDFYVYPPGSSKFPFGEPETKTGYLVEDIF